MGDAITAACFSFLCLACDGFLQDCSNLSPRWLLHTCHCVTTPCACGRRNHSLTDALAPEDRQALLDPEDGETIAHERNEHVVVDAQPQDMEREGRKMKVGTGGTKANGYGTSKGDKR